MSRPERNGSACKGVSPDYDTAKSTTWGHPYRLIEGDSRPLQDGFRELSELNCPEFARAMNSETSMR